MSSELDEFLRRVDVVVGGVGLVGDGPEDVLEYMSVSEYGGGGMSSRGARRDVMLLMIGR